MRRCSLLRLILLSSLALAASDAAADSLACDGGIVSLGDSRLDLLAKCGPPSLQEAEPWVAADWDPTQLIERWTYDFGPSRFLQVVSLKGGKVIAVERGSYGYELPSKSEPRSGLPIPRARCEPSALRLGDHSFEVLARCGEPVFRDLRRHPAVVEVWTYDFGPNALVRFVELQGGRVVRVRTGSYGYSK